MMISELPRDLLEEIFFRVPATSLNLLRSTCKQWNRLLKDMIFTTKHLEKAPKQFQSLMLKESAGVCLMCIDIDRCTVKGEARLTNHYSRVDQIIHCDGLLLCYTDTNTLVVWNPCTGETSWIQPRDRYEIFSTYFLGSYQDKRSNGNSYKILRSIWHYNYDQRNYTSKRQFGIYEVNSNSWRILDVTIDFEFDSISWGVSLKGKTYWIVWICSKTESSTDTFIVSFDYTEERFERLCLLPYQYDYYETLSLSVVRDEKLALLLQHDIGDKTEIWVTNKISETKEVSWSKVLAFDIVRPFTGLVGQSFVYDEEKKVLVFSEHHAYETKVYIVGEDIRARQLEFEDLSLWPGFFNYVPSLIRFQHDVSDAKEKEAND